MDAKRTGGDVVYRSKLEERVAEALDAQWVYEPKAFPYTTERKYTPDFVKEGWGWIEVKGYFRPGDTAKYKAIRAQYPNQELVMCFSHPHQPVRKGAKLTMAGWAIKNGWHWTTPSLIEEEGI